LATTVAAAFRREAGVALGNVIGSNIFNLLGIVGITALVGALPVPAEMLRLDLWVMLAASALLGAFIFGRRPIGRGWGAALLALYTGYAIILFT
jgi:cation:H+ antiporter